MRQSGEIRKCACGCGESFEAGKYKPKIFVIGHNQRLKGGSVTFNCVNCGKEVTKKKYLVHKGKCGLRFCSRKCAAIYLKAGRITFGSENAARSRKDGSKASFVCTGCGVTFIRYVSQREFGKPRYCSRVCLHANYRDSQDTRKKKSASAMERMRKKGVPFLYSRPHRQFVYLFKQKFGIELKTEFCLMSDSGKPRFFDCKVPDKNILFEIDGLYWHGRDEGRARDAEKDALAKRLNYVLIRVQEDNVEQTIANLELEQVYRMANAIYHQAT